MTSKMGAPPLYQISVKGLIHRFWEIVKGRSSEIGVFIGDMPIVPNEAIVMGFKRILELAIKNSP